jgi:hypothetical protein
MNQRSPWLDTNCQIKPKHATMHFSPFSPQLNTPSCSGKKEKKAQLCTPYGPESFIVPRAFKEMAWFLCHFSSHFGKKRHSFSVQKNGTFMRGTPPWVPNTRNLRGSVDRQRDVCWALIRGERWSRTCMGFGPRVIIFFMLFISSSVHLVRLISITWSTYTKN